MLKIINEYSNYYNEQTFVAVMSVSGNDSLVKIIRNVVKLNNIHYYTLYIL